MTPEERAKTTFEALQARGQGVTGDPEPWIAGIAAAIRQAVADEREACAETARSFAGKLVEDLGCKVAKQIATAIRARGKS